jgi:hypothetical protein
MNRSARLLTLSAGLLCAAGTAQAGTCSAEIEALQKTIASIGSVAGNADTQANTEAASKAEGMTRSGAPGGTVPAPDQVPAARTGKTAGAGSEPVPAPNGTDATGGMVASAEPGGSGSGTAPGRIENPKSSADMVTQAGGAGGAPEETAPQDSTVPEAGPPANAAVTPDPDAASQSLARAQLLDQAGDESGCMKEVAQAKSQLGEQ